MLQVRTTLQAKVMLQAREMPLIFCHKSENAAIAASAEAPAFKPTDTPHANQIINLL
jgi:hypothetical protein